MTLIDTRFRFWQFCALSVTVCSPCVCVRGRPQLEDREHGSRILVFSIVGNKIVVRPVRFLVRYTLHNDGPNF